MMIMTVWRFREKW